MRLILFAVAALCWAAQVRADGELPVLRATGPVVSIREGATLYRNAWRLAPDVKPDVYEATLTSGRPLPVTFLSDVDSIRFLVQAGQSYDFIIQNGADRCLTRVTGVRVAPAAVFDRGYQAAHRGRISVEVPEVYELVNIVIALTPTGIANRNLVYHGSDYYAAVMKRFDPYRSHPLVAEFDSVLRHSIYLYANLKMNGYAFDFDGKGRLVRSRVYDRTGFPSDRRNWLVPYQRLLQSFADTSGFRAFYRENRALYESQVRFYTDTCGVDSMRAWLDRNFPGRSGYDGYKVIFSPLVAYNQSATWMEGNGYRELQAHVNYPYPQDVPRRVGAATLSPAATTVLRGDIVFTELNHGYINPEADRYEERVLQATSRREHWVEPRMGSGYYEGISTFNEYMNWGLVSLRAVDLVPAAEEQRTIVKAVDDMMTGTRGFPRFRAFDAFLVELYRRRAAGQTVADLYPRIVEWFEMENAAAGQDPRGAR